MLKTLLLQFLHLPLSHRIGVSVIPVLFAVTVHEVAHGWVARYFGDPTAARLGRLTLNPFKHIDPVGTILVPAFLILMSSRILFGWAKPVPVTWSNLRRPKRDMALVAAAGPSANLLMALLWGIVVKIGLALEGTLPSFFLLVVYMGVVGIFFNVLLMVFNLLPLPPLDGGRVAVGLLPGRWALGLSRLEPYGFFIVVALLFLGVFQYVIGPAVFLALGLIAWLLGLS